MKIVSTTERNARRYGTCRHCTRAIQPGQVILHQRMLDGPMTNRKFVVHVRCIRKLIEAAPPDADERAFLELRELIHATGEAFPDG